MEHYMGIDVGSSSIKIAIIDNKKEMVSSTYRKNTGIIETIKKSMGDVEGDYNIKSVGCTGSGRNFTKILVGGDIIKTEILAHGLGALTLYPDAKTIMDIGAEDSKIILVENGEIYDFIMNTICSAGCGAMLEAIATRIGVRIEDVGDFALQSKNRVNISSKCGVFAQSSVVTMLNKGLDKKDILMGVCRALINNYMSLAKNIALKPPYVFQGMTAKNKALAKALEEHIRHEIIIPEHCELMGAYGMAILAKNNRPEKTNFKGFQIKDMNLVSKNFVCGDCENRCEVTQLFQDNNFLGSVGSRCGKWENRELIISSISLH